MKGEKDRLSFCALMNGLVQYNTTQLRGSSEKLVEWRADHFCPNVQARTIGIIGLAHNGSGNSQENFEGVFYPLAYKSEYNKKIAQFLLETMSGPLLLECQMVVRVASLRDPVEMVLFDFSSRSLSLCLSVVHSAQPAFLALSLAPSLCAALICR